MSACGPALSKQRQQTAVAGAGFRSRDAAGRGGTGRWLASAAAALAAAEAPAPEAEIARCRNRIGSEADTATVTDEAADAHDEAMLDLIALEMGAADEFDLDEFATTIAEQAHIAELAPAEPEIAMSVPEPIIAVAPEPIAETAELPVEMPRQAMREPSPPTAVESAPEPDREVSLGSSILASGIVRKPGIAANDPLAPIRRMSQVEKIAFFS